MWSEHSRDWVDEASTITWWGPSESVHLSKLRAGRWTPADSSTCAIVCMRAPSALHKWSLRPPLLCNESIQTNPSELINNRKNRRSIDLLCACVCTSRPEWRRCCVHILDRLNCAELNYLRVVARQSTALWHRRFIKFDNTADSASTCRFILCVRTLSLAWCRSEDCSSACKGCSIRASAPIQL